MNPDDEKFQKYIKTLDGIRERMLKAGYMTEFGHSADGAMVSNFTEKGMRLLLTVCQANVDLGGLTQQEIVCLWTYLGEHGKRLSQA